MILDPNQTFFDKAQRLSSWGHWFTFFNIIFALVLSSRFIMTDALPTSAIGYIYLLTNWIGHTAFITFICFIISVFPISLVFPYPKHIRGMGAVIASAGMILLTIDAYSYSRLGYHISGASLEQVVTLLTNTWNDHPVRSFMWVFGISSAILILELILANYTWKHIESLKNNNWGGKFAAVLLTAFVSSHCIHIWADANLNYDVTKQNNMFPFSYPATAKTLLAKNGLLDKQQHQQAQVNQLALQKNLNYFPPQQHAKCQLTGPQRLSIYVTDGKLTAQHLESFKQQGFVSFDKHYVPSNQEDAIFNLLYGLPALYKNSIVANQQTPQWLVLAEQNKVNVQIEQQQSQLLSAFAFIQSQLTDSNQTIRIKALDQQELLQLASNMASHTNAEQIILLSELNQQTNTEAVKIAPMLVRWHLPNNKPLAYKGQVSQLIDINTTIIDSWLQCENQQQQKLESFGKNFTIKQPKQLAANYTAGTIVSIHKDKITMLDDQANALQISATNGYKLNQSLDIPSLNDTINLLKRYSKSANTK